MCSIDDWTSRHWQRTSAVQCCHNQPLIDKVVPIYFQSKDGKKDGMSQIFISDKARGAKQSGALENIKRSDSSIGGPEYSSTHPYIAILADLGLNDSGFSVTFPTRYSSRSKGDAKCLRIHARGFSPETYPFLQDHRAVLDRLHRLVQMQGIPHSKRPLAEFMRGQVQYGSSAEVRHMNWEGWNSTTVNELLR